MRSFTVRLRREMDCLLVWYPPQENSDQQTIPYKNHRIMPVMAAIPDASSADREAGGSPRV